MKFYFLDSRAGRIKLFSVGGMRGGKNFRKKTVGEGQKIMISEGDCVMGEVNFASGESDNFLA